MISMPKSAVPAGCAIAWNMLHTLYKAHDQSKRKITTVPEEKGLKEHAGGGGGGGVTNPNSSVSLFSLFFSITIALTTCRKWHRYGTGVACEDYENDRKHLLGVFAN